ncbi:hypothetical protein BT96DRAFT_183047 [Gymnopus androsaceus JB14]|uniref:Uncharacterized protein n=1 Tax=Gymnopus androsaceus JB14 TaxID=1447944 RepID=A0A6A4HAA1_9AGAR|nr:hypothetical protein BT96DRAFT_183047 [Gymnopus androsaceus JB14]
MPMSRCYDQDTRSMVTSSIRHTFLWPSPSSPKSKPRREWRGLLTEDPGPSTTTITHGSGLLWTCSLSSRTYASHLCARNNTRSFFGFSYVGAFLSPYAHSILPLPFTSSIHAVLISLAFALALRCSSLSITFVQVLYAFIPSIVVNSK